MNKQMSDSEYQVTSDMLLQAGRMIDLLDLNGFRARIRDADSIGAIMNPTLYRAANKNLEYIDQLAHEAIRLKSAFYNLKSQVRQELEAVTEESL